ncbi:uncharacterized protein LOC130990626 [Salvia miltiorrhiza]|uniref:uncharacterized protein LOC130990626 n=1 Tax=Salvia miltiorrhiza TaxID=226208 RepID=UPI0025AD8787|nr:uncharacterized protein LOC130990626 [Salvia miltiorrhiza]
MEVYIDDMLVKSIHAKDHIDHLRPIFNILREYNIKLNPTKCSFGVTAGNFLGYMVTQRGIEANPARIDSIQKISSPTCVKDVQKLTGRIAALSRFILKSSNRPTRNYICCMTKQPDQLGAWRLYVYGSSNMRESGLGLVLISPLGDVVEQSIRCEFKATNNESEYKAMLAELGLAMKMRVKRISVFNDSQLVVNQIQGAYRVKDAKMIAYLGKIKELQCSFEEFTIIQVPRGDNSHADALANLGSSIQAT